MYQTAHKIKSTGMEYLLFLPSGYNKEESKKWPVIFFLHGIGERGNNVEMVSKHGPHKRAEKQEDFPFIVVAPQCKATAYWSDEKVISDLNRLYDGILATTSCDPGRVYLTGLSMGGFGAWAWAAESPRKFAAVVPICGGGASNKVDTLVNTPVWAFHGAKDMIVPPSRSVKMVEALKKAGGHVDLTIYPDAEHDSWTETYENPELYQWMLSHKRE